MSSSQQHSTVSEGAFCVIIPTFNNERTIDRVIREVRSYCDTIIVVNDGSTDRTPEILRTIEGIDLISYPKNKGKGYAIRQGFARAIGLGFDHAVTLDGDGQHFAGDLVIFQESMRRHPGALILGSRNITAEGMPTKNTFANKFSNFWVWVETGLRLPDTQSGYRLYPVAKYKETRFFTDKYEFELEVLVRSAWSGIRIIPVPVQVHYPEDRVSHFRPLRDFGRISVLNTVLVLLTFLYIVPRNAFLYLRRNKFRDILREQLLAHNETPFKIAAATGFGVFMGIVPVWGFQMILAAFLAHFMKLNKIIVLAASNISIPPMIPLLIYFSYQTGGLLVANENPLTWDILIQLKEQLLQGQFYATLRDMGYNLFQYVAGAFVFGAAMGLAVGFIVYFIALAYKASGSTKY